MAGELNFGLLDPNTAVKAGTSIQDAYQRGQATDQANALNLAQLQHAQSQNALQQYQLGSAKRSDEQANALNAYMSTPGFNFNDPASLQGLNRFGAAGQSMIKSAQENRTALLAQEAARLAAAKAKIELGHKAWNDISQRPSDANIIALTEDLMTNPMFTQAERAPIAALSKELLAMPFAERGAKLAALGASASDLKPTTSNVPQGGQTSVVQTPAYGGAPVTQGVFPATPLPANVEAQKRTIASAGAPKVSLSTGSEKKYGEIFASKTAEADIPMLEAARAAPEMATNANRVLDLAKNKKVITGSGAEMRLSLAKMMNMAGATDSEAVTNTEQLISGMAKSTLSAIKGSGLGTGQGFTENDLKFLQQAQAGNQSMELSSIIRLAELQHKAAVKSVQKWESRKANIPKSALEGTGIDKEVFTVPPMASGSTSGNGWGYVGPVK
jgi:hypothetical protein